MGGTDFTDDELAAEAAAALPDREAMSAMKGGSAFDAAIDNLAMPINEAIAMNIQSTDAVAIADADQIVIIEQVDTDGEATP